MKSSVVDECLFYGKFNGEELYLCLYVDDGLLFATSKNVIEEFLKEMEETFKITRNSGSYFVGFEIERNRKEKLIKISQTAYVARLLTRFGHLGLKARKLPIEAGVVLSKESEGDLVDATLYREKKLGR